MNLKIQAAHRSMTLAFAAAGLLFFAADSNAQTKKPKKRVPASTAAPVVTQSEPMIISRANDFPDPDAQIVQPAADDQTETAAINTDGTSKTIEDLQNRIKTLEAGNKADDDRKQKRLLLNLDILTRSESRSETLRKQLFDIIEKENTTKTRLETIQNDVRPESIDRSVAFAGTLRPEELRDARKKSLEAEKTNLQNLLIEIQRTRSNLEQSVQRADAMVEKLRVKLEKEIDAAIDDNPQQ